MIAHGRSLRVQLGAFDRSAEGWLNTDVTPHLVLARIPFLPRLLNMAGLLPDARYRQHKEGVFRRLRRLDVTRPLPFADGGVEAFYASHVLEHLRFEETRTLLREIHRCLAPNGVCRVSVPDLEKAVGSFDPDEPRPFLAVVLETSARGGRNLHRSGYTGRFLVRLFREAGFRDASVVGFRQGRCPDLERLDNRPEESVFVEAVRERE